MKRKLANHGTRGGLTRRSILRGGVHVSSGLAAALAVACSDETKRTEGVPSSRTQDTQSGGTSSAPAQQPKPGGILKGVTASDVSTLDPITTRNASTSGIAAYTYNHLLKYKTGRGELADGTLEPDVIVRWEQLDELTVVMHLRPGMKLDARPPTNGRAITTEDIILSWDKYASDSIYRTDLVNAANKDASLLSVRALDDTKIEIKTAFPDAQLLPVLGFLFNSWVLPKEALTGGFDPSTTMRGAGPWTLEQFTPSVGFSFKKNPNYYDATQYPLLDGVELPIIVDAAQAAAQFKSKNVYWASVPSSDFLSLQNDVKDTRITLGAPAAAGATIGFGWRGNSPYKDKRVRQAISMLIDRDTFVEVFYDLKNFQAAGVEMHGYWQTPLGAGYGPFWLDPKDGKFGPNAKYLQHDVAEAKKLLAAAGYPNGFEAPFSFISGTQFGRDWQQKAEVLMAMLAEGGIVCDAKPVDYTSVWTPQYSLSQGDYDGMTMHPNGSRGDPGQWLQVFFSSSGTRSQALPDPAELNALIARQRQELDRTRRIGVIHDIQRYMVENLPAVPQGGTTEVPTLSWAGLRGLGEYFQWAGNSSAQGMELYPYCWLDDSLHG